VDITWGYTQILALSHTKFPHIMGICNLRSIAVQWGFILLVTFRYWTPRTVVSSSELCDSGL